MMSVDLIADVELTNPGSNPHHFATHEETAYFIVREQSPPGRPNLPDEIRLYRTDGTEEGTKEVYYFQGRRITSEELHVGDKIFFSSRDADHGNEYGHELWASDGTPEGTSVVARLGDAHESGPTSFITREGILYFSQVRDSKSELWRSDGTSDGTFRITQGIGFRSPVASGDKIYFIGTTSNRDERGLWMTDGSLTGTVLVKAFTGGGRVDFLSNLTAADSGKVYFIGDDGVHGRELWLSDGTPHGTRLVLDHPPDQELFSPNIPGWMMTIGDRLFFIARTRLGVAEFWTSDGTAEGTRTLSDHPGELLAKIGDSLLFQQTSSNKLWITDGTPGGSRELDRSLTGFSFAPEDVMTAATDPWMSSVLYTPNSEVSWTFVRIHETTDTGTELYHDDGTDRGPQLLKEIRPGEESGVVGSGIQLGNEYLFTADDGVNGRELWKTDGTHAGTLLVKNIGRRPASYGSHPSYPTAINGSVYFIASGSRSPTLQSANEIWVVDQTGQRIRLLMDINPGRKGQPPDIDPQFTEVGDTIFFIATTATHGSELWKTDGSEQGTSLVVDLQPGPDSSFFARPTTQRLFAVGDQLFFLTGEIHQQLWKTDGTAEGTAQISAPSFLGLEEVTVFRNEIYFVAADGDRPRQLWRTRSDTGRIESVPLPAADDRRFVTELTVVGDLMYFVANTKVFGNELWVTDGSAEGTRIVRDILVDRRSSSPQELVAVHDRLYFTADTEIGRTVWVSDGSLGGTRLVAEVLGRHNEPHRLTAVGNLVFFQGRIEDKSDHLWVTDGTHPGTRIVTSLKDRTLIDLHTAGGKLFFRTSNPELPRNSAGQLWVSDGTPDRTSPIPGIDVSQAELRGLRVSDDLVYVSADDGQRGFELWRIDPTNPAVPQVTKTTKFSVNGRLDRVDSISFQFSHDVGASLTINDLSLLDCQDTSVHFSATLHWDAATLTATWRFTNLQLNPGYYTARLSGTKIRDTRGALLDGNHDFAGGDDHVYRFEVRLTGDANGDGAVDFEDVVILAQNFARRDRAWRHGDFDGDGRTTLSDFVLLTKNFGGRVESSRGSDKVGRNDRV